MKAVLSVQKSTRVAPEGTVRHRGTKSTRCLLSMLSINEQGIAFGVVP
jgi:hypothetical protein